MMHINILGTFIVLFIRLNDVSSQRRQCLGSSNYCPGQFGGMASICRDGFCVCTGKDYNYNTCLPDAYGCKILENSDIALASPQYNSQQPRTIYSCTPDNSSKQYEVHVMSVYEGNRHTRPPSAGDTNVNIVSSGKSGRPIVLVFASYEPVNWILNLTDGITISKVILISYYIDESSVSRVVNQVQVERKSVRTSEWSSGYGSDLGGGDTVGLLRQLHDRFGSVTSFTGTYRADEWSLVLSSDAGSQFENHEHHQKQCFTFLNSKQAGDYKTTCLLLSMYPAAHADDTMYGYFLKSCKLQTSTEIPFTTVKML